MKDLLLWIVAGLVLVAVFGDGGLAFTPTISPALDAQLSVQYAPDRSVTTIEQQTNIDTNIERQQTTIVYQAAPVGGGPGVNLVDAGPGRCATQVGDVVESEQGNGACFVVNADGLRFFVNPNGNRWPVDNGATVDAAGGGLQPLSTPAALVQPGELTVEQLQAAFLRNGGALPWFWNLRSDDDKRTWLTQRGETWR